MDYFYLKKQKYKTPDFLSALHHLVDKVGPSLSNIAVFVGMKGSSEELGLKACNTWYYKR